MYCTIFETVFHSLRERGIKWAVYIARMIRWVMHTFEIENLTGRDHLGDLCAGEGIIFV
jgi:hypothetical protein